MGKKRRDQNVVETSAMPMWRFAKEEMTPRRAASLAPSVAAYMSDRIFGLREAFYFAKAFGMDVDREPEKVFGVQELLRSSYGGAPTAWCDSAFFDLLGAAALSRTNDGVRFDEFVLGDSDEPCGWLTFGGEGIDVSRYVPDMPSNQAVKAIHWWTIREEADSCSVIVTCWSDRESEEDPLVIELSARGLAQHRFSAENPVVNDFLISLIVMFEPVARSKRVQRLDKTARPKRSKNNSPDRSFVEARLVKIEETDDGMDPELAAALGIDSVRNGRRLHWVRGHSKLQWTPSIKRHRRIWVDGYDRGDANLGVMPNRPVLTTARMKGRAESQ